MDLRTMQKRLGSFIIPLLLVCVGASAVGAQSKPQIWKVGERLRPSFPTIELKVRQSGGAEAIKLLGQRLPEVAAWYGKTAEQLRDELTRDRMLRMDETGHILFVEELDAANVAENKQISQQSALHDGALTDLNKTFYLHSHPGAHRTIYLDFNGATISGTAWNKNGASINAPPYDIDAAPNQFSDLELQRIQHIWQRVAEDYAPFDVDVTTEEPPFAVLNRSDANDHIFGTTVVITKTTGVYSCSCGGIAYLGVFNAISGSRSSDYYKPALVFYDMLGAGAEKPVAEAISHEAGHNLGLHHDGTSSDTYFSGQGSDATTGWAPIMGSGYYKPLVQFSRGEYSGANNKEDDFIVAQSYGVPIRRDDHGNTALTSTPFPQTVSGGTVNGSLDGVIEDAGDSDVFQIAAGSGPISASVSPASRSPNLDTVLSLIDNSGNVLVTSSPVNKLGASITYSMQSQGMYYLAVKGAGQGDAATVGYSNYGSVGNFRLKASFVAPTSSLPTATISVTPSEGPAPHFVSVDGMSSEDDGHIAFWYWDFGDGNSEMSGSLASTTHVYQVPGRYLVRLTVVDNMGLSSSSSHVVNVISSGPQSTVQSIQMTNNSNKRGSWAVATVTVVDQVGKPLRGAKVSANWNGVVSKSVSATTSKTGKITLTSPRTMTSGCFNLTVSGITSKTHKFNANGALSGQTCR